MKKLTLFFLLVLLCSCQGQPTPTPSTTPTPSPMPPTEAPTATPVPTSTPKPTLTPPANVPDRFEQARRLGRGVNLGNALEAPNEGEWGMVLQEEFFPIIKEGGFDTIRVPIRWSAHALPDPPYTVDETFFERIDWVLANALAQDLNVVINMHHYEEIFEKPSQHTDRFIAIWKQIVTRYQHMPDSVYFEPLNEPHDKLTSSNWSDILAETIFEIRRIDNVHTLIVSGADWGGVKGLGALKLPEGEENFICTFHSYTPMLFTHQGAEWVSDEYGTLGVTWPGPPEVEITPIPEAAQVSWVYTWFSQYNAFPYETNPAGPKPIREEFDWAETWRERKNCPLWLGEFGAYEKADMQSRINWTTFMREEAESRGISWAYWEFGAGFGVYDRGTQQWNEGLLKALVPDE